MNQSSDPYVQLHRALVSAAAGAPAPRPSLWSRLRRWSRAHLVLSIVLVGATIGGSTAAAVMLTPVPTRSLRGAVPSGVSAVPERYRVFVSPQLEFGSAGWCAGVTFVRRHERVGGAGACEPAPGEGEHRIVETSFQLRRGDVYTILVTDQKVAAVAQPGGRLMAPLPDPTVPNGWKVAAFPPTTTFSAPVGVSAMTPDVAATFDTSVTAYDHRGHVVPTYGRDGFDTGGITAAGHRAAPNSAMCRLDLPGYESRSWRELSLLSSPAFPDGPIAGPSLLDCAVATVETTRPNGDGATLIYTDAAIHVLVDALHPTRVRPIGLAGARPLRGLPGVYALSVIASGDMEYPMRPSIAYAKREGNAWIVVESDSPAHRLAFLRDATFLP